jgi:hypothetical protein
MFKHNLQHFWRGETFKYGFSHTPFQIQEAVYAGFRWVRCDLPINSAAAARMITG